MPSPDRRPPASHPATDPGDDELVAIVRAHQGQARRMARAVTGDDGDADDAVAVATERFLLQARARGLGSIEHPSRYYLRIVRNAAVDLVRAGRRRRAAVPVGDPVDDPVQPDAVAMSAEAVDRVEVVLADLPERQRAALDLRYRAGLDNDDAGRQLGLNPNAFAQLLSRARTSFRLAAAHRVAGASLGRACDEAVLAIIASGVAEHPHADACPRCARFARARRESGGLLLGVGGLVATSARSVLDPRRPAGAVVGVVAVALVAASMLVGAEPPTRDDRPPLVEAPLADVVAEVAVEADGPAPGPAPLQPAASGPPAAPTGPVAASTEDPGAPQDVIVPAFEVPAPDAARPPADPAPLLAVELAQSEGDDLVTGLVVGVELRGVDVLRITVGTTGR